MTHEPRSVRPLVLISGLPVGGAESVTVQFLRHLAMTERTVPVCTLTRRRDDLPAQDLSRAGVPRHDLGARRLADPRLPLRLARLVRRERIDLIHAHGQDACIVAAAAALLSKTALVVTRHVLDEPSRTLQERGRARLTLGALRRADAVVAVSRAVADRLARTVSIPGKRIHVILNGIETHRFSPDGLDGSRSEVRRSLCMTEKNRVVLVPAVLREGKGHELLLRALPSLCAQVPDLRVLFAGDGERERELRREVADRKLERAVHFLGFRNDIPALLAAADIVVLPSHAEALPTVLLEAAAAGRPVVATRVGGIPEVVQDDRTGILVPPNDVPALGGAILGLLQDNERARRYGREARSLASARFGVGTQAEQTLDLWKEVAASRGGNQ
jgi:glycosyltransferase involved in cell wall biosynthesis